MVTSSITVEGGLFPADLLDQVAIGSLEGQDAIDFGLSRNQRLSDEIQSAFSAAHAHWESFQARLRRSSASRTNITRQDWMAKLAEELGFAHLNRDHIWQQQDGQSYQIYASVGDRSTRCRSTW